MIELMEYNYKIQLFDNDQMELSFKSENIDSFNVLLKGETSTIFFSMKSNEVVDLEEILKISFLKVFFLNSSLNIIGNYIFSVEHDSTQFALSMSSDRPLKYNINLKII